MRIYINLCENNTKINVQIILITLCNINLENNKPNLITVEQMASFEYLTILKISVLVGRHTYLHTFIHICYIVFTVYTHTYIKNFYYTTEHIIIMVIIILIPQVLKNDYSAPSIG